MQFFLTVKQRVQKEVTNQAFWVVNDQRNSQMGNQIFLLSNQAHALDGAIHGVIFPWLRDSRAFLLEIFYMYIINK